MPELIQRIFLLFIIILGLHIGLFVFPKYLPLFLSFHLLTCVVLLLPVFFYYNTKENKLQSPLLKTIVPYQQFDKSCLGTTV